MHIPTFQKQELKNEKGMKLDNFRLIVDEKGEAIQVVSKEYSLIQHTSVYKTFKKIDHGFVNEQLVFTNNGARMYILATAEVGSSEIEPIVGDLIKYGIAIENSVDKSRSLCVYAYTLRLACTNGMTHRHNARGYAVKHAHLDGDFSLEAAISNTVMGIHELSSMYIKWTKETVNDIEKAEELAAKLLPKKYLNNVEITADTTKWDLFNQLTSLNTHDAKREDHTKLAFNRKIEDLMLAI